MAWVTRNARTVLVEHPRECHLRRGRIVFIESCCLTTPSVAKLMSGPVVYERMNVVEHWLNHTDGGKPGYLEKNLSQ